MSTWSERVIAVVSRVWWSTLWMRFWLHRLGGPQSRLADIHALQLYRAKISEQAAVARRLAEDTIRMPDP